MLSVPRLPRLMLAVIGLLSVIRVQGQASREDSLLRIARGHRNDIETFDAYKALGELTEKTNRTKSIAYYRQAVALPFHTDYARAFVEAYNALGELYHLSGKYDTSLVMHRQALRIAQRLSFEKEIAETYQGIGLDFMRQSLRDSARAYFQQALSIYMQLRETSKQAAVYVNLGNVSLDESNYTEALELFIQAEKIYEGPEQDKDGLSKALGNIGNIESILGNSSEALSYTQRALRLSEETGNELNVAYCHRLLGRIYRRKTEYEKALSEYREAIKVYTRRGDYRNESETYQSIGNIHYDLHQYINALDEYERSLRIARSIANPSLMAYAYSGIGFASYELKKHALAIAYFDSSMIKAKEIGNRYLVMDAYQVMSRIHEEQGRFPTALRYHRLYAELKDSLVQEEHRQGTEEMEAKYQNAKKQSQIDLLQRDQLVKNISLQQSRTLQSAMVLAFVLLIIIGLLVYNRHRLVHKAKRQMEIESMRNNIARDLHDDMGSTLSSIHIISQLALKENQESSSKYFQRISEHSAKMMESMSDMVWSINPENDSLQKMLSKMKEFSAEILEPKNMAYEFRGEETLNGTALDVARRKNIFLIFKESINNAAKYSGGTFIDIRISHVDKDLMLVIRDNGKGFDFAKIQHGNGLRNMRERAREINASLNFDTVIGQGTTLTLTLPLT